MLPVGNQEIGIPLPGCDEVCLEVYLKENIIRLNTNLCHTHDLIWGFFE